MTQYKFVGTAKDIPTLNDLGYEDNLINTNKPIAIDRDGYFDGCKTFDEDKVCVCVNDYTDCEHLVVYRYKGKPNSHKEIGKVDDPLPYIQELIDAGLVEIVSEKGSEKI